MEEKTEVFNSKRMSPTRTAVVIGIDANAHTGWAKNAFRQWGYESNETIGPCDATWENRNGKIFKNTICENLLTSLNSWHDLGASFYPYNRLHRGSTT